MNEALKISDALRYCVDDSIANDCKDCVYHNTGHGCISGLMLDAAKVIEKLCEDTNAEEQGGA